MSSFVEGSSVQAIITRIKGRSINTVLKPLRDLGAASGDQDRCQAADSRAGPDTWRRGGVVGTRPPARRAASG